MRALGADSVSFDPTAEDPELVRAIAVVAVWVAVLVGAAVARFTRSDVN